MRVIIAGGRDFTNLEILTETLDYLAQDWDIQEVVSGKASGADFLGEVWASKRSIQVKGFPANWDKYGSKAGGIRNKEMAQYADVLVAFWDGKSPGTRNMLGWANVYSVDSFVYDYYGNLRLGR